MRILVNSGYSAWGDFDPRAAYRRIEGANYQIGGGETAMVNISHELANLGHEVMVFYGNVSGRFDGVDYLKQEYAVAMANELEHDALITWDNTDFFRFYTRSRVRVAAFQLNDARIGIFDHLVDLYPCPSKWHAQRFKELYPEITESKQRPTITNGVSPELYNGHSVKRQPYRVVYSSSPDRGLHHLLAIWPKVVAAVPKAELHIYYDIAKWFGIIENCIQQNLRSNTEPRYHAIKEYLGELHRLGVAPVMHGAVPKWELAEAQLSAHVQAYPCDPVQPTEGFSMTCLEGLTAGCRLVTTRADALGELWAGKDGATLVDWPIDPDRYTTALVEALRTDPLPDGPSQNPQLDQYHWSALAKVWEEELEACLSLKTGSR